MFTGIDVFVLHSIVFYIRKHLSFFSCLFSQCSRVFLYFRTSVTIESSISLTLTLESAEVSKNGKSSCSAGLLVW